jgi:hypothetical protein
MDFETGALIPGQVACKSCTGRLNQNARDGITPDFQAFIFFSFFIDCHHQTLNVKDEDLTAVVDVGSASFGSRYIHPIRGLWRLTPASIMGQE